MRRLFRHIDWEDVVRAGVSMALAVAVGAVIVWAIGLAYGCQSVPAGGASELVSGAKEQRGSDPTAWWLTTVGGLTLAASIVLIFVTKGGRGWITLVIGLFLLAFNLWIVMYRDQLVWVAVPTISLVTVAIGLQVWKSIKSRQTNGKTQMLKPPPKTGQNRGSK